MLITVKLENTSHFQVQDALVSAVLANTYQVLQINAYSHADSKNYTLKVPKNAQAIVDKDFTNRLQDRSV